MKPVQCEFESEVLSAVFQSRWPEHADASLREHAAHCAICSDVLAVAGAFDGARDALLAEATLPDASRVWRQAQLRARRESVRTAGRPITAAQVIAFACAMGLLGACFGATSTWFQSSLGWLAASATGFDMTAMLSSAAKLLMEHAVFLVSLVAAVLLVPTIFYVALGRD